jgi:hypothetical protein
MALNASDPLSLTKFPLYRPLIYARCRAPVGQRAQRVTLLQSPATVCVLCLLSRVTHMTYSLPPMYGQRIQMTLLYWSHNSTRRISLLQPLLPFGHPRARCIWLPDHSLPTLASSPVKSFGSLHAA